MRLRVSGRSSDLSRIQIHQVAAAFRSSVPDIEIIPQFRESLGDRNQQDPLWAMPEKGVFTEDFVEDLRSGKTDVVVHSWKDLPTEPREHTEVAGTLPRADTRDVLLIGRDRWERAEPGARIALLSSSPRRAHNLESFLAWALPVTGLKIEFVPVRGNVPTRIRKLVEGEEDGLVVAKAALDRLLGSTADEFAATREEVRRNLELCHWMVLPISANPTGAAQGALAMEIAPRENPELARLVGSLNDPTTFSDAERERQILRSYGGGCHQKIGVTVLTRPYGTIVSLRGRTDAGETLDRFELEREQRTPRASRDRVWPVERGANRMRREPLDVPQPDDDAGYWVARADALPMSWKVQPSRPVWTAGLETWRRLAQRGVWVNGSAEGLGEDEEPGTDIIADRSIRWIKLTHDRAEAERRLERLATYRLISSEDEQPDLDHYSHFFWTSGSRFLDAVERQPEIADRWHGCGPGNTYGIIRDRLGSDARIDIWLSHDEWLKDVTE